MSLPNSGNPSPMETMAKERVNIPFDIRKMGVILHGSEESLALKERFMLEMSRDPVMQLRDVHDLSKDELRERTMEKIAEMRHYVKTEDSKTFARRCQTVGLSDAGFQTRFGVSTGLFLGAIRNGSTKEQWDYWVDKGVLQMPERIIGCFGMTELEHGSNVAGLLTTATLDKKTDEFIIHTPNLGATKWWIGGAAQSATHCSVFAQLMVDGKRYGTKTFIVPIRDPKTFKTLPGILIGDIGRKMGRDGVDNGYLQFSYVRVPRDYMMMKYTQVSKSGEVTDTAAPQMAYGALISGRVGMVTDSAVIAKKGLTIAIRYGIVRRQFSAGSDDIETQILDYPIHQRRLMPLMAQAIAIGFASMTLQKKYEDVMESRSHLGPSQLDPADHAAEIKELHVMAAGLKAFSTWACLDMLEKSRQTCGGHGYSAYSTFPQLISDFAVQCTWEGDNTVLMLQSGRALVSYLEDVKKGKNVPDGVAYLKTASSSSGSKSDGSLSLKDIERGFEKVTSGAVEDAYAEYSSFLKKGQNKEKALESCSNLRFVAARLHSITWLFKNFVTALNKTPAGPERKVLEQVCRLYGLWQVELEAAQFLSSGYFGKEHLAKIQTEINDLCLAMRKCAIPLTDAFFNTDFILNSPLGRYDGDVYNAYFDTVRRANPAGSHPYFDRVIKPLLEAPPVNLKGKL